MTYRAINLHEPHDCPDPETDYLDPVTRTLHVLQVDNWVPVQGYSATSSSTRRLPGAVSTPIRTGRSGPPGTR